MLFDRGREQRKKTCREMKLRKASPGIPYFIFLLKIYCTEICIGNTADSHNQKNIMKNIKSIIRLCEEKPEQNHSRKSGEKMSANSHQISNFKQLLSLDFTDRKIAEKAAQFQNSVHKKSPPNGRLEIKG